MNKTNIEWCDMSWNPVTGCLHKCPYCYARGIARRFAGHEPAKQGQVKATVAGDHTRYEVLSALSRTTKRGKKMPAAFPMGFEPTLHRNRLKEPQSVKKPQTIFVCSMADLFGDWVPDEWIQEIFDACRKAPYHRYLFLTKNPVRYLRLNDEGKLPTDNNFWFGSTCTTPTDDMMFSDGHNTFISAEPLMADFGCESVLAKVGTKWVIVGRLTGAGEKKHFPKREWVDNIIAACEDAGVPLFFKESMVAVVGEENMRREFPWEVK